MTKGNLAALILLLLCTVKATAQPQTGELTLRCDGRLSFDSNEQKSIANMGLVVNFTKKTVTGFVGVVANIYKADDATISFEGEGPVSLSDNIPIGTNSVAGSMDGITGKVLVETTFTSDKTISTSSWDLSCTPTRRLFPAYSMEDAAVIDCTKKLVDLSPRDALQCMWQRKELKDISKNITDTLDRLSNKTIGEWIDGVGAAVGTIKPAAETIILLALIVPPWFSSYVFPLIFLRILSQRFSGRYILTLGGSEKRQFMFWGIYLLVTGAGMALIGRAALFALLQGGWECFVGVAILVLGPNWWGIYSRMDRKVIVGQIAKRTRKAAVLALQRHLNQVDISKNLSDVY